MSDESLEPELCRTVHYRWFWFWVKAWRTISWSMVRLLVCRAVVIVEIMFSVSTVAVVPLQLQFKQSISSHSPTFTYLGFESVILLREILLPVVVRVAPPVAPLEDLVCRDVYVLEVVFWTIAPLSGYWKGSLSWSLGPGETGDTRHESNPDCDLI